MKQFTQQITLKEMEAEIKRELAMRERLYPQWINSGKMEEYNASLQILKMKAVLVLIQSEIKKSEPQGYLFQ